jgi:N-acetylmuramoyl-L-alanine amidase
VPRVLRLVPESRRAWHAGESEWQGRHGLNDQSIGIEIVYESHCPRGERSPSAGAGEDPHHDPDAGCAYGDYPPAQIAAVTRLAREILARHPDIDPTRVVGHADIAPGRKDDPGPRFPWRALHESGVGAWYDAAEVQRYGARIEQAALSEAGATALLQEGLAAYGYGLESTGVADARTRAVVLAFQSHFLPDHRTGLPDTRTAATALALLARYRPAAAAAIAAKYGVAEDH